MTFAAGFTAGEFPRTGLLNPQAQPPIDGSEN
jgi:hypothetical protein